MRLIGRLAMPIFVFGLVEGFIHTSSRTKYFIRLAIFAIITELVLYFLQQHVEQALTHNILFNFLLAFLALMCVEKNKYLLILVPIMAGLAEYLRIDYGWAVIVLAIGFYLTLKFCEKQSKNYTLGILFSLCVTNGLLALVDNNLWQLIAIFAAVPLILYSGKKGRRLPKYVSYSFYPAHLLLILVIKLLLH